MSFNGSYIHNRMNNVFIVASYNHIAVLDVNNFTIKAEVDTNYVPKLVSYCDNLLIECCNGVNVETIDTVTNMPVYATVLLNKRQLVELDHYNIMTCPMVAVR